MANDNTIETKTNGRITALNGKFRNYKTIGLGERDATYRFGLNIPADMPINYSAGYDGHAIRNLSDETEGRA